VSFPSCAWSGHGLKRCSLRHRYGQWNERKRRRRLVSAPARPRPPQCQPGARPRSHCMLPCAGHACVAPVAFNPIVCANLTSRLRNSYPAVSGGDRDEMLGARQHYGQSRCRCGGYFHRPGRA
jgi:hypothetical protein